MTDLDDIADQIGTITYEQTEDSHNREQTTDLPRRNLNEYDGAYDPEGRSDRESYERRCNE
jgi:hypothetical protein